MPFNLPLWSSLCAYSLLPSICLSWSTTENPFKSLGKVWLPLHGVAQEVKSEEGEVEEGGGWALFNMK